MLEQKDSYATLEWCGTSNPEDITRELAKASQWGEHE
jgi:hypothetical protein